MASNKIQFRSIHELKDPALNNKLAQKEFQEEIPVEDFLEMRNRTVPVLQEEIS
jgi:molybdopterin-containing oxidoreductase family iron-sulfur binding subunit